MAVLPQSSVAPFGAVTLYRAVSSIEHGLQGLAAWSRANRAESSLHKLSDRELADIGLERGDIPNVAKQLSGRR